MRSVDIAPVPQQAGRIDKPTPDYDLRSLKRALRRIS